MKTLWHGNIFRITGSLWDPPSTNMSGNEAFWHFLCCCSKNCWTNGQVVFGLRRACDIVIVLQTARYTPWFMVLQSHLKSRQDSSLRPALTRRCFPSRLTSYYWSTLSSIHPLFIYLEGIESGASTRSHIVRDYTSYIVFVATLMCLNEYTVTWQRFKQMSALFEDNLPYWLLNYEEQI